MRLVKHVIGIKILQIQVSVIVAMFSLERRYFIMTFVLRSVQRERFIMILYTVAQNVVQVV